MAGSLFSNAVISFFVNTKQAESALGNLQNKFTGTTTKMLGAIAGFAGIKGLKGTYDQLQRIVQVSEKWNLPIEDLSRFVNLFSQFGGDADEAVASVERLQKLANDLSFHSNGAFKELSALISTNLQNKDYQGAINAFRRVFNSLADSPNGRNAQAELVEMIGADYPAMLRMLRASNDEYQKMVEQAGSMRIITQDMADSLTDADKKLADIKQRWANIYSVALQVFEPLLDVAQDVTKWLEGLPDKVIHTFTIIGTFLSGWSSWALGKLLIGKILGIGGTAAATTTAASTAGAATTGAGAGATTAATTLANTVLATAGVGTVLALTPTPAGETPEQLAALNTNNNSLSGDLGTEQARNESEIQRNLYLMRQLASKQLNDEKWGASKVPTTNNDNRSVTINIYGVDGAADMMEQLRSLPMNNMSPITWK